MKVSVGTVLGGIGAPLLLFGLVAWLVPVRDLLESRFAMGLVHPFAWLVGLAWARGDVSRAGDYLQQEPGIACYFLGTCLLVALLGALVALLGALVVGGIAGSGVRKVAQKS